MLQFSVLFLEGEFDRLTDWARAAGDRRKNLASKYLQSFDDDSLARSSIAERCTLWSV